MTPYYDDGSCVIYHGDCREVLPFLPLTDLLLTDPPYGVDSVGGDGKMGGAGMAANRIYKPVHGDDAPLAVSWLLPYGERQIIWGIDHAVDKPSYGRLIVWDKRDGMPSNHHADAEVAWDSAGGPCRVFRHRQMGMVHDGYGDIGRCHPNQKPLALMSWVLNRLAPTVKTIVDPFMGSGTVLRAAKDSGRRAIGIEIEERYCEIAAKRLAQEVLAL